MIGDVLTDAFVAKLPPDRRELTGRSYLTTAPIMYAENSEVKSFHVWFRGFFQHPSKVRVEIMSNRWLHTPLDAFHAAGVDG